MCILFFYEILLWFSSVNFYLWWKSVLNKNLVIHNIIQLDKTEVSVNRQSDFPLKVSMKFVKNALESGQYQNKLVANQQ